MRLFEWIVELLIWFLVDLVGYNVAPLVLPLVSVGRIRVAPFNCDERV
ncbi:hypothetical protein [Bradyrhizobium lablabi]|nr:hypothetical protein [Bradyrhizobium lablabi]MBR0694811.1 hypothetical protein [Bradyrhizobium lablabi]